MPSSKGLWGILAGLGLVTAVLAACGGGSSSSTGPSGGGGGSSGAVVQGQLVRRQSAALGESTVTIVLRTTLGIGVAEAAAGDPVGGVTVTLTGTGGTFTTTTNPDGSFLFTNVPPGTYTIQLSAPFTLDATSQGTVLNPIVVGAGDSATLAGTVTETAVAFTVHVAVVDVSDVLQNDAQLCHAVSISTKAGVDIRRVFDARMADGGHGWGQVARQFGVHPSYLGNNRCDESQLTAAAAAASGRGHGKGKGQDSGKGKKKGQS